MALDFHDAEAVLLCAVNTGRRVTVPMPRPPHGYVNKGRKKHAMHLSQSEPIEPDIVLDHCVRSDWYLTGVRQIKLAKHDLVAPDLSQKIPKDEICQLFTRTASVSKPERSEAGIVANWIASPVRNNKYGAEPAICDPGFSSVLYFEIGDVKRTTRQADLLTFVIVDLRTGWNPKVPLRIDVFGSFQ